MRFYFFKYPIFSFLFLLVICFLIYFSGIGNYGLLDKDEPCYCGSALEMIESNNWIVPKFNFQNRLDKPILFHWLIATSYKVFGVSDFTSRLPSSICAALCVLFTWYIARRIFGSVVGLISALILATSIEFVLLGRRAATDIALCFFFSSSLYCLFLGYYIKDFKLKIFWTILSGIFSGLSVLTKGPLGVILPLIILSVFLLLRRQFDLKHLKIYVLILFLTLLISLPWYILIHFATGGLFTQEFFFKHNIERFITVVGEHPGPLWFYIPVIFGGFMPWTLFFLDALFHLSKHILKKSFNRLILFCLIWILVVFLFFSFSTTKLATYVLLLFPPLALISGYWVCVLGRKKLSTLKSLCFLFIFLILVPSLYYGFYLITKWKLDPREKNIFLSKIMVYLLVMISLLVLSFVFSRKYYSIIINFAISVVLPLIFGLNTYLISYYKYTHADLRNFAEIAKSKGAKEIISFGMYRPSLVFYSRVPVDYDVRREQVKKIKSLISQKKEIFIIGHSSDIQKHNKLFEKIKIIDLRKKYFIGKFN